MPKASGNTNSSPAKGSCSLSNPIDNLMSDGRAKRIERYTQEALAKKDWLPPVALELALASEALLLDRQARCELMAAAKK